MKRDGRVASEGMGGMEGGDGGLGSVGGSGGDVSGGGVGAGVTNSMMYNLNIV